MAIVLPRSKKKRIDIFAPRKSVQDAKEKLGPAYFDPSLLQCSRNAIELNKLVNKWEDIDKEKVKHLRDLARGQNALARAYKKNSISKNEEETKVSSDDFTETIDGKPIPPGFRFRSNGDLKPSLLSLPHVSISDIDEDVDKKPFNSKSNGQEKDNLIAVDYDKEIAKLRGVIVNICEELSKSKIGLFKSYSGNFRNYLRGHTTEYTSVTDYPGGLYNYPNDRFAFQPGSSNRCKDLYTQTLKTPSSRVCTGCQFKLKRHSDNLQKVKGKQDIDILKQRWNYVPAGKYVESSTVLSSNTSLHRSPLSQTAVTEDQINIENSKPSSVKFRVDTEIVQKKDSPLKLSGVRTKLEGRSKSILCANGKVQTAKNIKSSPILNRESASTTRSELIEGRSLHSALSRRSTIKSGSSETSDNIRMGRSLESSISYRSGISGDRISSRLLADYDSRLNLLKEFQADQMEQCDTKVKDFLQGLGKIQKDGTKPVPLSI